jgi:predicted RNase H-like nuclease
VRVLGVDGCRGGWLAAVVEGRSVTWRWTPSVAELLAEPVDAIAIDMPIGLPEAGVRACDVAARRRLGRRGSSVFAAPVRPVLQCTTYAEARALLAARGGASMSAQAFGIVRAVRDLDDALSVADEDRVVEVHPEVVFRALAGTDLPGKKTLDGRRQRMTLLTARWPDVARLVDEAPRPAAPDDALDALACARTAERWLRNEVIVLGDGGRDSRGLPMRIAY